MHAGHISWKVGEDVEVYNDEIHLMTLTHHTTGLTMTLVATDGGHFVHCQRFNEFEQVKLSRTREKARKEFIDFFFAANAMLKDAKP